MFLLSRMRRHEGQPSTSAIPRSHRGRDVHRSTGNPENLLRRTLQPALYASSMVRFKAVALRWVSDEPQPGIIEISVRDAAGQEHRIHEKAVVAAPSHVSAGSDYPIEFWVEAESRDVGEGLVAVTLPWSMSTTRQLRTLTMARTALLP